MRALLYACVGALFCVGTAFAETSDRSGVKFIAEVTGGGGYTFAEDLAFPSVEPTSLNSAFSLGIRQGDLTFTVAYLEAKNDQEGRQATLAFNRRNGCFGSEDTLGCSLSLQATDVENYETVKLSAGLRGPMDFIDNNNPNFDPDWTVNAAVMRGDRDESTLGAGVELAYSLDPRGDPLSSTPDWRWTINVTASAVHAFEANTTLPIWGVRLDYNFTPDMRFSLGYESRVVINDENPDDLDVDRAATARFRVQF